MRERVCVLVRLSKRESVCESVRVCACTCASMRLRECVRVIRNMPTVASATPLQLPSSHTRQQKKHQPVCPTHGRFGVQGKDDAHKCKLGLHARVVCRSVLAGL